MSQHHDITGRVTTHSLRQMKAEGEQIASLTAYAAAFARVVPAESRIKPACRI